MTGGWKSSRATMAALGTIVAAALVLAPTIIIATAQAPLYDNNGNCFRYCPPPPCPDGVGREPNCPPPPPLCPDGTRPPCPPAPPGQGASSPAHVVPDASSGEGTAKVSFSPPKKDDDAADTSGDAPKLAGVRLQFTLNEDGSAPAAVVVNTREHTGDAPPTGVSPLPTTTLRTLVSIREGAPEPVVLRFVDITVDGVDGDRVRGATIQFRIPHAQALAENLDLASVRLLRFANGEWQSLETRYMGGDLGEDGFHTFDATSPGFSTFAVAAGKIASTTVPATVSDGTFTCPNGDVVAAGTACPGATALEPTDTENPPPPGVDKDTSERVPAPGLAVGLAALGVAAFATASRRKR